MSHNNATSPATTRQDHPDNKGVFVELWVLDLVDGDHVAALLLSQVLWWHVPAKNGRPKIHFERKGYRWLVRSDDEWMPECRLSIRQVRRIRRSLVEKGLVITARFRVDGVPLMAWRPNYDVLDPEVTDSRSNAIASLHGSTPSASLHGSSANGSLPIPSAVPHKETSPTTSPVGRSRSLPADFDVDQSMSAWASENHPTVDVALETDQWRDYHLSKGDTSKDWRASWRTWMRNAAKWAKPATNGYRRPTIEEQEAQQEADDARFRMGAGPAGQL